MANIKVISRKFYNQLDNGEDFTLNTSTFTKQILSQEIVEAGLMMALN
jgi:hypothetical protein